MVWDSLGMVWHAWGWLGMVGHGWTWLGMAGFWFPCAHLADADGGGDARADMEALVLQERGLVVAVDHHLHPSHSGEQRYVLLLLSPQDQGQPWGHTGGQENSWSTQLWANPSC